MLSSLFMCTRYTLCFRRYLCVLDIYYAFVICVYSIYIMPSLFCQLNIHYAFVIYMYSIYMRLLLFICTQYTLCLCYLYVLNIHYGFVIMSAQYTLCFHRYLCVLDIYYAFIVIYVFSIYIMLSSLFMCTQYKLCFSSLFISNRYTLCFHRYLCVLNIYYAFIVISVYSIYIMISSLFMCNRYILCFRLVIYMYSSIYK